MNRRIDRMSAGPAVTIIRPGLLTSIQDLGRYGLQKYGVIASGAMDPFALRVANLLVGNEEGEAALEITMVGPTLEFQADVLIAICGGNLSPRIDGQDVANWRPLFVKKGSTLTFGAPLSGCRAYLAVAGSFDVPEVMGSRSTYLRAGIGGFQGRALKEGDVLRLGTPSDKAFALRHKLKKAAAQDAYLVSDWTVSSDVLPLYQQNPVIRVIKGGQFDLFSVESRGRFLNGEFTISTQSDRMGYRLSGPTLHLAEPTELISEAVSAGTVQVPPEGNPIVLMADRQTTGGYPKIAQVISVDLPVLAQAKPGERVRFVEVSVEEAQEMYQLREMEIHLLKQGIELKR